MNFPKSTSLFSGCTGQFRRCKRNLVPINGASEAKYEGILKFEKSGNYTLNISSRDISRQCIQKSPDIYCRVKDAG
jgi:hypothetical protein